MDCVKLWKGSITVDGVDYSSISALPKDLVLHDDMTIVLHGKEETSARQEAKASDTIYRIKVRKYMTQPSEPRSDFQFMAQRNNNIPMPLRIMVGTKHQETSGMVYMKLHGDITQERSFVCMKCGRELTNPVSQYFGIGPECGGHNYINPFNSDAELREAVSNYRKELNKIVWEGWIIKSAIEVEEVINGDAEL